MSKLFKIGFINPPNLEEPIVDAGMIPVGMLALYQQTRRHYTAECINLYNSANWEVVCDVLASKKFNIICIPCYTRQRHSVLKLAALAKTQNDKSVVILGGPHATYLDAEILTKCNFVDYIIRREGDITLLRLLEALYRGDNNPSEILGLSYRYNGKVIVNPDRPQLTSLTRVNIPQFREEDVSCFQDSKSLSFHFPDNVNNYIAPLIMSRGCDNNCIFCCNGSFWGNQIYLNKKDILWQLEYLTKNFNIHLFDVYDDNLLTNKDYINELCKSIKKSFNNIKWWCSTRADSIDDEIAFIINSAGCFMVSMGAESGSSHILNRICKGLHAEHIYNAASSLQKYGISVRLTISIGHPDETDKDIEDTIQLIQSIKPAQLAIFYVKNYPGTPLYIFAKNKGMISDEYWFDPNEKTVPFFNTNIDMLKHSHRRVYESIKHVISNKITNAVFSSEYNLKWS